MSRPKLTAEAIHDAFMELGAQALVDGKVIDLAIYGGSALMLASNFRIATQDVDAVAVRDQDYVNRLAAELAARRDWRSDWLNDGVRTYLSPNLEGVERHHELFRAYPSEQSPGLRVFVPSAEYILAMKLMAMRIDSAAADDLRDILNLLDVVELKSEEEAVAFAASFYPEARISGRLRLGLRELWRRRGELTKDKRDEPPTYPRGGGPTP
jgi:hypothetical protein